MLFVLKRRPTSLVSLKIHRISRTLRTLPSNPLSAPTPAPTPTPITTTTTTEYEKEQALLFKNIEEMKSYSLFHPKPPRTTRTITTKDEFDSDLMCRMMMDIIRGPETEDKTPFPVKQKKTKSIPYGMRYLEPAEKDENLDPIFREKDRDDSIRQKRASTLKRVRHVIARKYGSVYQIEPFGSVRYGATSETSDMDLVILDNKRYNGFEPGSPLPAIYDIYKLAKVLKQNGFIKVVPIPAKVPIVKFQDAVTGIECDINVNDQTGYWNTMLLQRYCELSPHLRRLLLAVKRWAKPRGFNSPSPAEKDEPVTFSSYALALMTVGFLQHRGLLPNLQDNISPKVRSHPFWNKNPQYLCDLRFNWYTKPFPENDQVTSEELLFGWFKFWRDFDAQRQMVDIRLGGIIPRKGTSTKLSPVSQLLLPDEKQWEDQAICVIDPFILPRNVAGNIKEYVIDNFQIECGEAVVAMST